MTTSTPSNNQPAEYFIEMESPRTEETKKSKLGGMTNELPRFTLEWKNLKLTVKNKSDSPVPEKTILNDVSGCARPGELLVIMGPSGAGKSSLLDCIADRNSNAQGSINVNGKPWSKRMRQYSSYVQQDDLFHATLKVKEHLMFQAKMRMGNNATHEEHTARVNLVMEELGLTKCKDSLIGNEQTRGISGGERKRLSFATELLTNPSILFVDEPTSGLDSFMAESVVRQLRQLARNGRTVIATIHQPSSEIFALYDQLYLLSNGSTVYFGKATDSVSYFASLGYQCPQYINPCDYFMRQLVVVDEASDAEGVERVEKFVDSWKTHSHEYESQLIYGNNITTDTGTATSSTSGEDGATTQPSIRRGFFTQIRLLAARNIIQIFRDPLIVAAGVIMSLFVAMLVSVLYWQLEMDEKAPQNFVGAIFFIVVNQVFAAANPTFVAIPIEIPIVVREYQNGLYHLVSWYVSKNVSELFMQIFLPIIFFVPTYFLVGFGGGFEVYLGMQIFVILANSGGVALGYFVSCLARRVDLAPLVGIAFLLPFLLFGGVLINSDSIPGVFSWIKYISPITYSFDAIMRTFWDQVDEIPCNPGSNACTATSGDQVLAAYSVSDRSVWLNGVLLVLINLGYRVAGFLVLWLYVKSKK